MLISVIMHSIALAMYACLEEVVWCSAGHHRLTGTRARIELKEGVLQMLINLHDRCLITTSVAVIGC